MRTSLFILGLLLILSTLLDAFETILLPRRITRRFRYSRLYYRTTWRLWRRIALIMPKGRWRETMFSVFGPMSMLGLFGSWIISLILGFAVLHWSIGSIMVGSGRPAGSSGFLTYVYFSGTNYFTLGLGDITPLGKLPRALTVVEAGLGLGFLAIIISYLPVLYQAFSRREVTISLMDARAGSPPGAGEFLMRVAAAGGMDAGGATLREWEQWCAELLESHISFPVLAYYRSQHANQSWLASLATVLDTCVLMLAWFPDIDVYRVQLTFAMARHALVDIALIFGVAPNRALADRLPTEERKRLRAFLQTAGLASKESTDTDERLAELRGMYEPILGALATHFALTVPPLIAAERSADNWQRSAWLPRTPGIGSLPAVRSSGEHFD